MEERGEWYGLVFLDEPRPCVHCRKPIVEEQLAVANTSYGVFHLRCSAHHGWVPSHSEALTIAMYSTMSPVVN